MGSDKGGGQVGQRESGLGGQLAERTDGLQLGPVGRNVQVECLWGGGRPMAPSGIGPSRQPSAAQRAIGQDAHAVTLGDREHGALDGPSKDRVAGLLSSESVMAATLG